MITGESLTILSWDERQFKQDAIRAAEALLKEWVS